MSRALEGGWGTHLASLGPHYPYLSHWFRSPSSLAPLRTLGSPSLYGVTIFRTPDHDRWTNNGDDCEISADCPRN